MDDAGIALYQELTRSSVGLSDYFDRNYLRNLGDNFSFALSRAAIAISTDYG
jgi:hypothetical protein